MPKRSDQRRRANKPKRAVNRAAAGGDPRTRAELVEAAVALGIEVPTSWTKPRILEVLVALPGLRTADPKWHPLARLWFESLGSSGQSAFYESSDWATAHLLAESISREFSPVPTVVSSKEGVDVIYLTQPPKASSVAAWLKGMTALLATEGDRRRLALELERGADGDKKGASGEVAWIDDARARLRGAE